MRCKASEIPHVRVIVVGCSRSTTVSILSAKYRTQVPPCWSTFDYDTFAVQFFVNDFFRHTAGRKSPCMAQGGDDFVTDDLRS